MVLLGGDAGLRLGEIVALKWGTLTAGTSAHSSAIGLVRPRDGAERWRPLAC